LYKVQKLAFYEVGTGKFGTDVQSDFEEAQKISMDRGVPVTIKMEITVFPPAKDDERFGNVSYKHELKQPAFKSIPYITELNDDGVVVNTAKDEMSLLQLDFLEPEMKTTPFERNEERHGE